MPGSFHSEERKQLRICHVADGASGCPRRISLMLGATGCACRFRAPVCASQHNRGPVAYSL